jgi:FAD/FMN-containing dehydrogenase
MTSPAALGRLRDIVGDTHVLTEPDLVAGYVRDWTGRFVGATPAVVRPASTPEVAAVITVCRHEGLAVVAQGGNTGLVAGGVPLAGEIVVTTSRLTGPVAVDTAAVQATAWAGASLEALQRAAAGAGLGYGVDLASRGSASLGGTIATNAGGLRVLRYGDTRAQLVGVEAVLGDGTVVSHLDGVARDNTGYHLPSLLAGSEGTLGIITRATVRLVPVVRGRAVAMVGLASVADAAHAAGVVRAAAIDLHAVELMVAAGVDLVSSVRGLAPPLAGHPAAYLLVEAAGVGAVDDLAAVVAGLPGVTGAAVADDPRGRASLWEWRESHTESINTLGPPVKMDVTLPAGALADFLVAVPDAVRAVHGAAATWLFGHAGDGAVHVNVTGATAHAERIQDAVLRMVAAAGGSISTEHGIGTSKRHWLRLARSDAEIRTFRRIKAALDPDGILNPHVLLPAE